MSVLTAWLEVRNLHTEATERIKIQGERLSIGKGKADLTLKDSACSPIHALIVIENGSFVLRDLSSATGTYLNRRPIVEARLSHLDEIKIGASILVFHAAFGVAQEEPELIQESASQLKPAFFTWIGYGMAIGIIALICLSLPESLHRDQFFVRLGFLLFCSAAAYTLLTGCASIFFGFNQSTKVLRFLFRVGPWTLIPQLAFLLWAVFFHPSPLAYFSAAALPTLAFLGMSTYHAVEEFQVSYGRASGFALCASVPWNVFLTVIMSLVL